jgi:inner membrane protein
MDNLTHTLIGASLARAGLGRNVALAGPALLIGANLPDIDNFTGRLFSSLEYFDYHRGWPHSLVGATVVSAGLAGALWAIGRFRSGAGIRRPRFPALFGLAAIAAFSHILMDLMNDYGLRPFLPFSGRWYYGDLISIVDPWIWLMFGCALFAVSRSGKVRAWWVGFSILVDVLVFLVEGVASGIFWGIAAVAGGFAATLLQRKGIHPARAAFAAFAIYLGGIAVLHGMILDSAWKSAPGIASAPIERIAVLPHGAGSPGGWPVILELPDGYCVGEAAGLVPVLVPGSFQRYPKNLQDPYYRESLSQPRMAALARFARFPSVHVEASNDVHTVFLRDLRYARRGASAFGTAVATVRR